MTSFIRRVALAVVFAISAASASYADTITTAAPNNASGGIFLDLTPTGPSLLVQSFDTYYASAAGAAVTVQVWTRSGTHVGNTTTNAGWTLSQTVNGTSAGTTVAATIALTTPIVVPAGGTTGIYLHGTAAGGGLRYTGTAAIPPQTTWSDANVTLFSTVARTGAVAFAGGANTPRTFAGSITYVVDAAGACCRPDGSCTAGLAAACATAPVGVFQGVDTVCASVACSQPGACCSVTASCSMIADFGCTAPSTFFGAGSSCSPLPCIGGACCKPDGACTYVVQTWCESTGGIYTSDSMTCVAAACPQPGACCLSNAGCVKLTAADCTAAAGTFGGVGVLCAAANCWTAPILYHNGGLVTHPGQGTDGADASLLAPAATGIGENWNNAAVVRIADDFTVPAGRTWTLNKFHAFGYQTGSATSPVPYTAMFVRIWDRDPRDPAAVLVWGDLTTNVLDTTNSVWTNIYRVTAIPGDATRPLFDLVANVPNVALNGGTYWVEYTANNAVTPFVPGVSTANSGAVVMPFGNGLIWRNAPWAPVVETTYQGAAWANAGGFPYNFPFVLEGSIGVCCQSDGTCIAATPASPTPTCETGTFVATGSCSPNSCQQPAGVCCRGATCNSTVTQADCTIASGAAGAFYATSGAACNAGAVSNTPCCFANYNKINGISVQDIFDFLSDWFAANPNAKVGGNGTPAALTVQSIFDFLANWFAGGC